jgi:hypothetical protein
MKNSDFGLGLLGPHRVLSTSADLYKNVQVHIPTKEELEEHDKRMSEIIRKYCYEE